MKHTCDLIGDLLPLYREGLASAESIAIVEEHVAACSTCAAELEALQQETPAVDTAALPLARVQSG
ncbi:MAG: zf-HC2 domain-containing protein, partial [Clostridiales bacterium]|nr:zf-HC2 domain-containing protein [Clostridiales bacterium]